MTPYSNPVFRPFLGKNRIDQVVISGCTKIISDGCSALTILPSVVSINGFRRSWKETLGVFVKEAVLHLLVHGGVRAMVVVLEDAGSRWRDSHLGRG